MAALEIKPITYMYYITYTCTIVLNQAGPLRKFGHTT